MHNESRGFKSTSKKKLSKLTLLYAKKSPIKSFECCKARIPQQNMALKLFNLELQDIQFINSTEHVVISGGSRP